jgi:lipoprotein NlpD
VPVGRLAKVNHLADPSRLEVGQRLLIPDTRQELPVDVITPQAANAGPPPQDRVPQGAAAFIWPITKGTITSGFGQRGLGFHDGIDIRAPVGAPVHAAQDGQVIYSDVLRGYGNVIIVRHDQHLATVYAHNQVNRVREGQRVRRGEVIGRVGESGRTSAPSLHFEVRQDNIARNPLYFLPPIEHVSMPPVAGERGG